MFTLLFISSLFAQNHIEKRYWDNYKLRIREVYEALPDGTYNGYRKCYNWDGIQDLNFLYKKGTMVKKQEFAKDGKTVVAELNADDDGNFHGMQFAKSFFTPGVASYNIKATMNHGEITTLQRFNENGKILDILANKVKSFEKGILTDDYLFSRETKLITGKIVEDQEKLIIKEGKIDSVFSRKSNQLIAFKDQDGLLVIQSVENGIFIEKKSINDMSLKAQIEFTTTFDVTFNGAYEYG
ncbi:MAG: hypothetical protein RL582_238, partial [Bacteroidota bacterium]